jgi:hypothetical protein
MWIRLLVDNAPKLHELDSLTISTDFDLNTISEEEKAAAVKGPYTIRQGLNLGAVN